MLLFVAALAAATLASGAWCAGEIAIRRATSAPRGGGTLTAVAVLLTATVGLAAALRFAIVPPHHAMYLDEPWYAEAACNLVRLGRLALCHETWSGTECLPYGKAIGWPVLISPWTMLGGCRTSAGIDVARVLGSATVLVVAVAARCAGATWWQAIFVAALLAIHPGHVAWSATGETNVAAAAALLAGICGALIYARRGRPSGAALAVAALGLSTAIRPECAAPAAVAALVIAVAARTGRRERLVVALAIGAACIAAAATGRHLWAMNESISGGAFLSPQNVVTNLRALAAPESLRAHGIVVLLALAGAIALVRSGRSAAAALLLGAGLSAALAVLAYDRFHERMLLTATICLLPLSGFGTEWESSGCQRARALTGALAGVAVLGAAFLLWRPLLLSAASPPETQVLETYIAGQVGELSLGNDALIVAAEPTVLAAAGVRRVMATETALRDEGPLARMIESGRSVYFLCDMFCEPDFQGAASAAACRRVLDRFAVIPVAERTLHSRRYGLYRLAQAADGGAVPPPCPFVPSPSRE